MNRHRLLRPVEVVHTLTPSIEHGISTVVLQVISFDVPSFFLLRQIPFQEAQFITQRFCRNGVLNQDPAVGKIRVDQLNVIELLRLLGRPDREFVTPVQLLDNHFPSPPESATILTGSNL